MPDNRRSCSRAPLKNPARLRFYKRGLWGERLARLFLALKGYSFLEKRFKTSVGEIDLIMRDGTCLVVVEVKVRGTLAQGLEAMTRRNQKRVQNAFLSFLTRHPQYVLNDVRFDLVVIRPWRFPVHMKNVICNQR